MCKDMKDDFIGQVFPTPCGGTLTVVGKKGKRPTKYILECSLCSGDKELWPLGRISCVKSSIEKGVISCGCGTSPRWTEDQQLVRIKRRCEALCIDFLGWYGEYKGIYTLLSLEDKEKGVTWTTTSLDSLLRGTSIAPLSYYRRGKERSEKMTSVHISRFFATGVFKKGTVFKRSISRGVRYWDVYCPVCSKDEYVSAGVCDGIFTSTGVALSRGCCSCRCSRHFLWTQEQREFQILTTCETEGLSFLGWENGKYTHSKDRLIWLCKDNHRCKTSIDGFINKGTRCKTCRDNGRGFNGYYPEKVDEQDFLYLMDFKASIKVGRSFSVSGRQNSLKSLAKITYTPEVLQYYTATHQDIYKVEQSIHEELRKQGFQYLCDWTNECFNKSCEKTLQSLIEGYVLDGTLIRC